MTSKRISELNSYPGPVATDLLPVVDIGSGETKKTTLSDLAASAASIIGGTVTTVPLATGASTELSIYSVLGAYALDASSAVSVELVTVASVTSSALIGSIQLWNLTDNSEEAVHTYTGTDFPTETSTLLTLPSGIKVYEIRHKVTGGSEISDRIMTAWAGLRIVAKPEILI